MKLARYAGQGRIEICEEAAPELPAGGLLVKTEASGLCSGELMDWYMERKVPHVLGHEVSGKVIASEDSRFPVGSRIAPHHHAPCMECPRCKRGDFVHCELWRKTRLVPGGMTEAFAVPPENLIDTHLAEGLRAQDAALLEPVGCVVKSLRRLRPEGQVAVIGLGSMGLIHMLLLGDACPVGIEISESRRRWAQGLGLRAEPPDLDAEFDAIVVCPGAPAALELALRLAAPQARILLFAPMAPGLEAHVPWDRLYFEEISLVPSYSCGPDDMGEAMGLLAAGKIKAEQVASHFIGIQDLPEAYEAMKKGEILKAMVMFE